MFFDSTPNILYPDFFEAGKFKLSKNLFRRVRARDSFNAIYATSKKYTILPGETADSIAYNAYEDSEWYWTILLLNNITDIHSEWPLDPDEFEKYIQQKYGDYENKPRHWETNKIFDANGDLVLDEGIIIEMFMDTVDQNKANYWPDWSYTYIDSPTFDSEKRIESPEYNTVTAEMNLTLVTNREYEYYLNEMKREIYLPRREYLDTLAIELETLLRYDTKYKITREGYRLAEEV